MASSTVRVLVALDVTLAQARDEDDLVASVVARVADEAGYLNDGDPVNPTAVVAAVIHDDTVISPSDLAGIYEVGVEGVDAKL